MKVFNDINKFINDEIHDDVSKLTECNIILGFGLERVNKDGIEAIARGC